LDGVKEYLFQDARINCYIRQKGAGVFELDYLPKEWNYLDCGSFGRDRRASFSDAIVPQGTAAGDLEKKFPPRSRLCFNEQYEPVSQARTGKSCFKLPASEAETSFGFIEIEKSYLLKKDVLTTGYSIKNTGKENENFCFTTEIDFSFAGKGEEFVRFYTTDNSGQETCAEKMTEKAETLKILDVKNEVQIILASAKAFSLCLVPAYNGGMYQADRIICCFEVSLESSENWTNEFALKFSH
jgi:hypothetical protein